MSSLYFTFFYQPVFNLLVFLYNIVPGHDLGIAIILMTIIIKLILLPLSKKSLKSQKALQDLQPEIEALKKEHGKNREELGKATLELYKKNKVNPFSSCLPLLIQMPFLIAVFRVFRNGFNEQTMSNLYSFITAPTINYISLGFINLEQRNIPIAVLAGLAQYWQAKMMSTKKPAPEVVASKGAKDENMLSSMNKQMIYFMPILTVVMGITFPGGLALYWLMTTLLTALQQKYIFSRTS